MRTFESIDRSKVAVANAKLYWNAEEGFVGTGLKRTEGELLGDCSDIDDIIVFRSDGTMKVSKVSSKAFFGKNLLYVAVWKRGDKRTTYNAIYLDGATGKSLVKRFNVTSITRDREYPITKGTPKSKLLYFTANPNGEAEVVSVFLRAQARLKKVKFDVDFSDIGIKGRGAGGNLVSKFPVRKVELKEAGVSTLGARKVWYDETVRRLNADGRGRFLGDFKAEDKILVLLETGNYVFSGFDLSTHFDEKMIHLEKFDPDRAVYVVYYEGEKDEWFVKRFLPEFSKNPTGFIGDHAQSKLWVASTLHHPHVRIRYNRRFKHTRDREDDVVDLRGFISVKGVKALGNKLSALPITEVALEAPVVALEEALEKELQTAREADDMREAKDRAEAQVQTSQDPVAESAAEDGAEDPAEDQGQATLF